MFRAILCFAALVLAAALAAAASASAAAVNHAIIAIDVVAKHKVVWSYQDEEYPAQCLSWSKGKGEQDMLIHSKRRQLALLETEFGKTFLSARRPGTFEGLLTRSGTWRSHYAHLQTEECSPCGPLSELGPCEPWPEQEKYAFRCGDRDLVGAHAGLSYRDLNVVIPSLKTGLIVGAGMRKNDYFPACPPNLGKGRDRVSLHTPWPDWENLPTKDTNRIMGLKVGDSTAAEARRETSYFTKGGTSKEGRDCARIPAITDGYGECAVTTYRVVFTRVR